MSLSKGLISKLRRDLLSWYLSNPRSLPWKQHKDPYPIWLSEIILQQTRVEQGLPYYHKFLEQFPRIFDLAAAPEDDILKAWEGLGYYSRARNLHHTAQHLVEHHKGAFPRTYRELLKLKGIGPYTAAAIASFAFDLPHAVVDGNVYRVLSRLMGDDTPIDSNAGKKLFQEVADRLIPDDEASAWNQAMMNLGAMICLPQNPLCEECPWADRCEAFNNQSQSLFPVKEKKILKKNRHFHFLVLREGDYIYLQRRDDKDVWKGLYQFPLVEAPTPKKPDTALFWGVMDKKKLTLLHSDIQVLTHQRVSGYFFECISQPFPTVPDSWIRVPLAKLRDYAFPKIIYNFISQCI